VEVDGSDGVGSVGGKVSKEEVNKMSSAVLKSEDNRMFAH
jgi:hypothetical protein